MKRAYILIPAFDHLSLQGRGMIMKVLIVPRTDWVINRQYHIVGYSSASIVNMGHTRNL